MFRSQIHVHNLRNQTKMSHSECCWPHQIKAIIFDCDGLLIDTEKIFAQAVKNMTGHELTTELHMKLMGSNSLQLAELAINEFHLDIEVDQFIRDFQVYFNALLPESEMMPGATELINLFDSLNVPMSLASGSNECNYSYKITKHKDIMSKIKTLTFGNEVKSAKPNPDIFLVTMKKLGISNPENCLVFEDAPAGIKAAVDGGFPCVMVPDPAFPFQAALDKFGVKPTIMLNSLNDFKLSMFDFSQFQK